LDLKWLEDFLSLANTLNFSVSADQRNVTQPTFSRRIRALERWLGMPIIDRTNYPPSLTPAGHAFYKIAEDTVRQLYLARDEIRADESDYGEKIRFLAIHTLSLTVFPRLLQSIESYTGPLKTRMVTGNLHDCVQALIDGGGDFLIAYYYPNIAMFLDLAGHPSLYLGQDVLIPVTAPGDNGRSMIQLPGSIDSSIPFLRYSPESFLGKTVEHFLSQLDEPINLEAVYENALAEALKSMAVAGYGLAWLPRSLIGMALSTGELVPAGDSFWHVPLTIRLYRCDSEMTPNVKRVWTAASDVARNGWVEDSDTQDGTSDLIRVP
jgi:DNA-binding transcriptional LysR family regulator